MPKVTFLPSARAGPGPVPRPAILYLSLTDLAVGQSTRPLLARQDILSTIPQSQRFNPYDHDARRNLLAANPSPTQSRSTSKRVSFASAVSPAISNTENPTPLALTTAGGPTRDQNPVLAATTLRDPTPTPAAITPRDPTPAPVTIAPRDPTPAPAAIAPRDPTPAPAAIAPRDPTPVPAAITSRGLTPVAVTATTDPATVGTLGELTTSQSSANLSGVRLIAPALGAGTVNKVRIPRPKGVSRMGRNQLISRIGMGERAKALEDYISKLQGLDKNASYESQNSTLLETVNLEALQMFPELDNYEELWPLKYLLMVECKNSANREKNKKDKDKETMDLRNKAAGRRRA
ncbi:hypothetical protein VKT23_012615 [Stygiomarasmius scandens]|uniref:Uncharacterized protein n=1 Tax=Marasmiellus scandens TaxID=2682957 RepID=A0ABR1J8A6_9AGAR